MRRSTSSNPLAVAVASWSLRGWWFGSFPLVGILKVRGKEVGHVWNSGLGGQNAQNTWVCQVYNRHPVSRAGLPQATLRGCAHRV